MVVDLSDMSLKDLKKLERDVALAISSYEARKRAYALSELEARARELGFTLAELTGAVAQKTNRKTVKYRNPENPTETWSGRGRKPAWFVAAIAGGAMPESIVA